MIKKSIMILVTKLSNGGAEKAATILAKNLSKQYQVYLVVFNNMMQDYKVTVPVIDLKIPKSKCFFKKVLFFLKKVQAVKKVKKQYAIDCTISLLTGPNLVNVLTKKYGKTIISVRNNMQEKSWLENKINQYVMRQANKIVTVAEDMRIFHIQKDHIPASKIVTIYNVCLLEEINKQSKEKITDYQEIFSKGNIIISLGRFINQKGQWHLIRAFSEIVKNYPEYQLIIFGRGEKKNALEKLIEELSIQENVHLLEFVNNPYAYLRKADFFVMSSLFEGCSNAILEAMACNLPVIATDCQYGNREILAPNLKTKDKIKYCQTETFGILVPVGDKQYYDADSPLTSEEIELYKAMKLMIEDKALRKAYQEKSLQRIQDFQNNTEKWINCIEEE